jgi:predicted glycosyl hydrolase (DUF1957 family)
MQAILSDSIEQKKKQNELYLCVYALELLGVWWDGNGGPLVSTSSSDFPCAFKSN